MSSAALQPDLILTLDFSGVIQSASVSGELAESPELPASDSIHQLVGKPWRETCDPTNASKVDRIVEGAVQHEVCGFSQINQRMPNGETVLFEFTAVQTRWQQQRIVVVGKNLNTVVKLQNRLLSTQRTMEKEFWKLREMETRYSALVNATPDVVFVLRDPDLKVIDINEQASRAIGLAADDSVSQLNLSDADKTKLDNAVITARQTGRAPVIVVRCGPRNSSWRLRVSSYNGQSGLQFMLQFSMHDELARASNVEPISGLNPADILKNLPEGLVAVNRQNVITHVNPAFAALVNRQDSDSLLGMSFDRWLPAERINDIERLRSSLGAEDPVYNVPVSLLVDGEGGRESGGARQASREVLLSARHLPGDTTALMLMLVRPAV